jgi:hypothetical protein
MRLKAKYLMNLTLVIIAVGVIITALRWPFKTALFPILVSLFLLMGTIADLLLNLFEREGDGPKETAAADFKLSEDIDPAIVTRKTLLAFSWIIGFFFLILLLGFPVAIPVMFFFFLKVQAQERWGTSLLLTGSALVFFLGLFVWLLDTPFQTGWVFDGLKMLGLT